MKSLPLSFLRYSLGLSQEFEGASRALAHEEWVELFKFAKEQRLAGLFYSGMQKLPVQFKPPQKLALRWTVDAESIRGRNTKVNEAAAALTQKFDAVGCRAFMLKGPANALYYPEPLLRQPGDIDLYIAGGKELILNKIREASLPEVFHLSSHHASFMFGDVEVEAHFLATHAYSPKKNAALQKFLNEELAATVDSLAKTKKLDPSQLPQRFLVPSMAYALAMQLSHIKQHFFKGGVGLRQLIDYNQLLLASSVEERRKVSTVLKRAGLYRIACAVVWVLQQTLLLEEKYFICAPDSRRGKKLLSVILNGGNFGWYAEDFGLPVFARWCKDRVRTVRLISFDAPEALWHELLYWGDTLSLIPQRLKQGKLALGKR